MCIKTRHAFQCEVFYLFHYNSVFLMDASIKPRLEYDLFNENKINLINFYEATVRKHSGT